MSVVLLLQFALLVGAIVSPCATPGANIDVNAGDYCGAEYTLGDNLGGGKSKVIACDLYARGRASTMIVSQPDAAEQGPSSGRVWVFDEPAANDDILLDSLGTHNGFRIIPGGPANNKELGAGIACLDYNLDGVDDLVFWGISLTGTDPIFVLYGSNSLPLDGRVITTGDIPGTYAGNVIDTFGQPTSPLTSVRMADMNADGNKDLCIGFPEAASNIGQIACKFSSLPILAGNIMHDPTGTGGLVVDGSPSSKLGESFDIVDWNADGNPDFIVGLPNENKIAFLSNVLSDKSYPVDFETFAITDDGGPVQSLGKQLIVKDINGDGNLDIFFSSPESDGAEGASYIYFGTGAYPGSPIGTATLRTPVGVTIKGIGATNGGESGTALSLVDMDSNNVWDLVIGEPQYNSGAGRVLVLFGPAFNSQWTTRDLIDTEQPIQPTGAGFKITNGGPSSQLGRSISVRKHNADTDLFHDLLFGETGISLMQAKAYVLFGWQITDAPSKSPSKAPSKSPTKNPTSAPSKSPSKAPSKSPSMTPSASPTKSPTKNPTASPSKSPTVSPTETGVPTTSPTSSPITSQPTDSPVTSAPTNQPTSSPSDAPTTVAPTGSPFTPAPTFPIVVLTTCGTLTSQATCEATTQDTDCANGNGCSWFVNKVSYSVPVTLSYTYTGVDDTDQFNLQFATSIEDSIKTLLEASIDNLKGNVYVETQGGSLTFVRTGNANEFSVDVEYVITFTQKASDAAGAIAFLQEADAQSATSFTDDLNDQINIIRGTSDVDYLGNLDGSIGTISSIANTNPAKDFCGCEVDVLGSSSSRLTVYPILSMALLLAISFL